MDAVYREVRGELDTWTARSQCLNEDVCKHLKSDRHRQGGREERREGGQASMLSSSVEMECEFNLTGSRVISFYPYTGSITKAQGSRSVGWGDKTDRKPSCHILSIQGKHRKQR